MDVLRYFAFGPAALLFALTIVGAAWAVCRRRRRGDRDGAIRSGARWLLTGGVACLLLLTFTHGVAVPGRSRISLDPTAGIRRELGNVNHALAVVNLAGNVLVFVPVGLFAVLAFRWSWWRAALAGAALSAGIELVQLTVGRSADVDDILLNSVGTALGAVLGALVARRLAGAPAPVPDEVSPR